MSDEHRSDGGYRLFSRLLARKGSAEPLPVRGDRLILSRGDDIESSAEQRLAEAVTDATLEALAPHPPQRRAAARLTDLFDPTLVDLSRRRRPSSED